MFFIRSVLTDSEKSDAFNNSIGSNMVIETLNRSGSICINVSDPGSFGRTRKERNCPYLLVNLGSYE